MKNFTLPAITVGAVMLLGGCATTRSFGNQYDDERLERRIEWGLMRADGVSSFDVDTDVLNNYATLRGEVPDERARETAGAVAMQTEGIVGVDNQLNALGVEREAYFDGDPDWLMASRIHAMIMANSRVKDRNVDVDVIDGEVYLSGIVEDEEARKTAITLAGDVPRVDKVHDQLQVANEAG